MPFDHVRTWVFDLDDTLYPPTARLLDLMSPRISEWIARTLGLSDEEARVLNRDLWTRHGTTLAGLMAEHDVAPDAFLAHVHDIPLDMLEPDQALAQAIARLPGRRIVFTNGSLNHAERVLAACGLRRSFDAIYGTEAAGFAAKPARAAFEAVVEADGFRPGTAAMFEDSPENLRIPHEMGMITVLVGPECCREPHVHHHAPDLLRFLSQIA